MSDRANVRISLTSNDDGKDCIRVRIGQEDFGLVTYEEVAEWLKEAAHKKWPRVRCPEDAMRSAMTAKLAAETRERKLRGKRVSGYAWLVEYIIAKRSTGR